MAEEQPTSARDAVVGLLLAGGRSTRFGSNKLCHPLRGNVPMVVRSARHLVEGTGRVLAIVRPEDALVRAHLTAAGIETLVCPKASEGMAATVACGVAATRDARGWVIALADMPFIRPDTIEAVRVAVEQGALLAAPHFRGRRGHPVGFGAALRDELLGIAGDEGARKVVAKHEQSLRRISVEDPGVLADIDSPDDFQRWVELDDR